MKKALFLILVLISLIILIARFTSPLSSFLGYRAQAGLKVTSSPEGADVLVKGALLGKTPWEKDDLDPQQVMVKIESGMGSWQGRVDLSEGTWTVVNRDLAFDVASSAGEMLTLKKGSGLVALSSPSSSVVEVDGKPLGKTPLKVEIEEGEHSLVISKAGYMPRSLKAAIPEGFQLILTVDLSLTEADLTTIATPSLSETQKVVVKPTPTGFLRVRDKASLLGKEIAQVKPGDELILLEELPGWMRVRLADGKEGYVSSTYVQKQ